MFSDPFFTGTENKVMKTDIKEKKDKYVIDMDLPGYEKNDIKIDIQDGYLTVHAKANKAETDKEEGKYVRKERYVGECSRSFYIGDNIKEEDIEIKKGEAIGQGIFQKFLTTDNDISTGTRTGGFGSTNK